MGSKKSIDLQIKKIDLPYTHDILVLGKHTTITKNVVLHTLQFLAPDKYEMLNLDQEPIVEAIFIRKDILRKITLNILLRLLADKVFPYIAEEEIIKVDLSIKIKQGPFEV